MKLTTLQGEDEKGLIKVPCKVKGRKTLCSDFALQLCQ